mgnify:CR=1 FL=1
MNTVGFDVNVHFALHHHQEDVTRRHQNDGLEDEREHIGEQIARPESETERTHRNSDTGD